MSNCPIYSGLCLTLSGVCAEVTIQDNGAGLCTADCVLPRVFFSPCVFFTVCFCPGRIPFPLCSLACQSHRSEALMQAYRWCPFKLRSHRPQRCPFKWPLPLKSLRRSAFCSHVPTQVPTITLGLYLQNASHARCVRSFRVHSRIYHLQHSLSDCRDSWALP